MTSSKNILVFTDLDGTLLDRNDYAWAAARPAIRRLQEAKIPIIFCTSKTRPEAEYYRRTMVIKDPFITENGGGIFIPRGYFDFDFPHVKELKGYKVIELAKPYSHVWAKLRELKRAEGVGQMTRFLDMGDEALSKDSGLSSGLARMAKEREYSEAFKFSGDEAVLQKAAAKLGISLARGERYWCASVGSDKGKAVGILAELFAKKYGSVTTIGLGDSFNDLPMLKAVDYPILMGCKGGSFKEIDLANLRKCAASGPEGWAKEIHGILDQMAV